MPEATAPTTDTAPEQADWIFLAASAKRCLCCNRWGGKRVPRPEQDGIAYDPAAPQGPCVDGPWNGTLRGPRNACGHWLKWSALPPDPEA